MVLIVAAINGIPINLHQKIINMGIQGPIKLEDQFKELHVYVDEMAGYVNWKTMSDGSTKASSVKTTKIPLNIHMRLWFQKWI